MNPFPADDPLVSRVIPGRWGYPNRTAPVLWVVMHTTENTELPDTDVAVARYFAGLPKTKQASAHYIIGDEIIQGWPEAGVAFAAPGANARGIQIELVGRARQTPDEWKDAFSKKQLDLAARLVANICKRHALPIKFRGVTGLLASRPGLTGHIQATHAFKKSTHTDPGAAFPWAGFLAAVKAAS